MQTPILLSVFNRPGPTAEVMAAIARARPARLYVAADGPRPGRDGEAERCAAARTLATTVDWPCEVVTLLRTENLGCKLAVSSAISWFFEHEPEGIILEDDCVPAPSFFPYCCELLEKYRDAPQVMVISGDNPRPDLPFATSYTFSKYVHIWGWASWRRAWAHYDLAMTSWPKLRDTGWLETFADGQPGFALDWQKTFDETHAGRVNTWDYQWVFSVWAAGGVSCYPAVNLVSNVGFGPDGTHTCNPGDPNANRPVHDLDLPLRHPATLARDTALDAARVNYRPPTLGRRLRASPLGRSYLSARRALFGV